MYETYEEKVEKMRQEHKSAVRSMYLTGCVTIIFWVLLLSGAVVGVAYLLKQMGIF